MIFRYLFKFFNCIPAGNNFNSIIVRFKCYIAKVIFKSIGDKVNFQQGIKINGPYSNISIGNNSGLGKNSTLHAQGGISIGSNVMIGQELIIHTARHNIYIGIPMIEQGSTYRPVTIGNNVWIGSRVTILPGVKIQDNIVIGAGSVVTKNLCDSGVYAGNPARFIKELESR
ncbi:acyltransferase [Vibrio splendidus]|uniref:acyltransferase n=1 Tax=Vibrio splendidus TaxID=29497 RepID=UPI00076AB4E9|nr:acyltransferase [Vibrio splendidus]